MTTLENLPDHFEMYRSMSKAVILLHNELEFIKSIKNVEQYEGWKETYVSINRTAHRLQDFTLSIADVAREYIASCVDEKGAAKVILWVEYLVDADKRRDISAILSNEVVPVLHAVWLSKFVQAFGEDLVCEWVDEFDPLVDPDEEVSAHG